MSTPIPSKPRTFSFPSRTHSPDTSAHASPQLVTPAGTPPAPGPGPGAGSILNGDLHLHLAAEQRLKQLLMNFDAGTHSICRDDRESPAEWSLSHGDLDAQGKKQIRRPSFLSSLSLSKPFNYPSNPSSSATTPAQTPVSGSFGLSHNFGFGMTPAQPPAHTHTQMHEQGLAPSGDFASRPLHTQSKSTPVVPTSADNAPASSGQGLGMGMARSQSHSNSSGTIRQTGFDTHAGTKRHFDPSKEPRLLGLL